MRSNVNVYQINLFTLLRGFFRLPVCGNASRKRWDVDVLRGRASHWKKTGHYAAIKGFSRTTGQAEGKSFTYLRSMRKRLQAMNKVSKDALTKNTFLNVRIDFYFFKGEPLFCLFLFVCLYNACFATNLGLLQIKWWRKFVFVFVIRRFFFWIKQKLCHMYIWKICFIM